MIAWCMAVSMFWGGLFVGVLVIPALLLGVHLVAPDVGSSQQTGAAAPAAAPAAEQTSKAGYVRCQPK